MEEFCQLCEKKMEKVERKRKTDRDLYVVEVVKVDTTRKQLKFISWNSVTNTMSGVITIINGITFFRSLGKNVFPRGRFEVVCSRQHSWAVVSLPDSFNIFSIMCARADSLDSSSAFEMV